MNFFSNQPQKGMLDEFPWELAVGKAILKRIERVLSSYHYEEYDAPVLEALEIFSAKSGDELIKEQAYTLKDKGDRDLILRPEMTPSLARMISSVAKERPRPFRWWSLPKCFRFERPQKGRLREFKQLNVDLMGEDSLASDLEMLQLAAGIMDAFQIEASTYALRYNHRKVLTAFLKHRDFTVDEQKTFYFLVDRVGKMGPEEFKKACQEKLNIPSKADFVLEYLSWTQPELVLEKLSQIPEASEVYLEFKNFIDLLKVSGLSSAVYSPSTVRGLDYYTGLVFEVFALGDSIGRSLFGGGRYDNLCGMFSEERISGIGFGMGFKIFTLFLEESGKIPPLEQKAENVMLHLLFNEALSPTLYQKAIQLASRLRGEGKNCEIAYHGGSIKKAIPRAEGRGFSHFIILGENELTSGKVTVKDLKNQSSVELAL